MGSPFSFFIYLGNFQEGLHVALSRAQVANSFKGIYVSGIEMSHLLYVDDVIILVDWDAENANRILCILRCFYMSSGLKINLHKCKLIGVGVLYNQFVDVANRIGCAPARGGNL